MNQSGAEGEFELIERFFRRPGVDAEGRNSARGVVLGVGDDCALLQPPVGQLLAVSMDTLVAGVHFPAQAPPALLGQRCLRVNLSDLAASGAEPLWFTLGLTLPGADSAWLAGFAEGLWQAADEFGIALVGGDTTRGPLAITVQVHGSVPAAGALRRDGARVGDRVFVTGCLGDGAAALPLVQAEAEAGAATPEYSGLHADYLRRRFYCPQPQLQVGQRLRGVASAAIDISDGLLADLGHICRQSGVGARLQWSALPRSAALRDGFDTSAQQRLALSGGDDYQLCFTVPEAHLERLREWQAEAQLELAEIGEITADGDVLCVDRGQPLQAVSCGYQHFAAAGRGS